MKIQEAIEFIEDFKVPERLNKAKIAIKESLKKLPKNNYEDIGNHFYYLLRIILKSNILFETDTTKNFFEKMQKNFQKQEKKYIKKLKKDKNIEIIKTQFDIFYQMMERYFASLEIIFKKKDFREARQKAFEEKMRYRKNAYFFRKEYGKYLGYKFFEISSNYGASFLRWGITSLVFIILFALIYAILNLTIGTTIVVTHWFDYIYFSANTFTTLGFGDILAVNAIGKFVTSVEVFLGFIMLGVLVGFVQKRLL